MAGATTTKQKKRVRYGIKTNENSKTQIKKKYHTNISLKLRVLDMNGGIFCHILNFGWHKFWTIHKCGSRARLSFTLREKKMWRYETNAEKQETTKCQ